MRSKNSCTKLTLGFLGFFGLASARPRAMCAHEGWTLDAMFVDNGGVFMRDEQGQDFRLSEPSVITTNGDAAIDPCTGACLLLSDAELEGFVSPHESALKEGDFLLKRGQNITLTKDFSAIMVCEDGEYTIGIRDPITLDIPRDIPLKSILITRTGAIYDKRDASIIAYLESYEFTVVKTAPKSEARLGF